MRKGTKMSDESKAKMRIAKLGKPSNWKGRKATPETRLKMSLAKKGRLVTAEMREKNRQGQIKRHLRTNSDYVLIGRNARIAKNGGFHTSGEWETLKAQYNWMCPCCKKREPDIKLTRDHIIPLLLGGSDNIENIQPLCTSCNCKKHTQTIKY